MPIPLWCRHDFDGDRLALIIWTVILLSLYKRCGLLSFWTQRPISYFKKIIIFYQLQPSLPSLPSQSYLLCCHKRFLLFLTVHLAQLGLSGTHIYTPQVLQTSIRRGNHEGSGKKHKNKCYLKINFYLPSPAMISLLVKLHDSDIRLGLNKLYYHSFLF